MTPMTSAEREEWLARREAWKASSTLQGYQAIVGRREAILPLRRRTRLERFGAAALHVVEDIRDGIFRATS